MGSGPRASTWTASHGLPWSTMVSFSNFISSMEYERMILCIHCRRQHDILCLFLLPLSGIPGILPEAGAPSWWGASPFREVEIPPKGRALRPLCSCSHWWLFPWLYFKEMTPKSFRQTFLGGETGKKLLGRFTYQREQGKGFPITRFPNVNSVGKGILRHREDQQAFSQTNLVYCLGHLHLRIYLLFTMLTEHKDCQIITLRCNCLVPDALISIYRIYPGGITGFHVCSDFRCWWESYDNGCFLWVEQPVWFIILKTMCSW